MKLLRFLRRRRPEGRTISEVELQAEYEQRREYAKRVFAHDSEALRASLNELEVWLRQQAKERITAPL
jgi:hypothetical protein